MHIYIMKSLKNTLHYFKLIPENYSEELHTQGSYSHCPLMVKNDSVRKAKQVI